MKGLLALTCSHTRTTWKGKKTQKEDKHRTETVTVKGAHMTGLLASTRGQAQREPGERQKAIGGRKMSLHQSACVASQAQTNTRVHIFVIFVVLLVSTYSTSARVKQQGIRQCQYPISILSVV